MIKRLLNQPKAVLKRALGIERLRQERDAAIAELHRYDGERDRVPAKLHAAIIERDAYHEQRDQAYRELDEVVQERNRLKGELERLRRELSNPKHVGRAAVGAISDQEQLVQRPDR